MLVTHHIPSFSELLPQRIRKGSSAGVAWQSSAYGTVYSVWGTNPNIVMEPHGYLKFLEQPTVFCIRHRDTIIFALLLIEQFVPGTATQTGTLGRAEVDKRGSD